MNKEVYVSWCKGLENNKRALNILKECNLISGVEITNADGKANKKIKKIKKAGLKVSLHNPGKKFFLNLASPNLISSGNKIKGLLRSIINSDCQVVGFHLGYASEEIYKMKNFPRIPKSKLIKDKKVLLKRFSDNLIFLESKLKVGVEKDKHKKVLVESPPYTKGIPLTWDIQSKEVKKDRKKIEKIIEKYGINVANSYIKDLSFLKDFFKIINKKKVPIGYLFDISHNFVTADTKIRDGSFNGSIKDYFDSILKITKGKVFQLHINVPGGNEKKGYYDKHNIFDKSKLSKQILDLIKHLIKKCPEIKIITLEMQTSGSSLEHAKEMVNQTEFLRKELLI